MRLTIALVIMATLSVVSNQANGQDYGYEFSDQEYISSGQEFYSSDQGYGSDQGYVSSDQEFYSSDAAAGQAKMAKSYREAYQDAQAGDKPLLVLITATWCPPCRNRRS